MYKSHKSNVGLLAIEKEDEDGNISYIDYLYNPDGSLLGFRYLKWGSSTLLVDNIYYCLTGHGGDVLAILDSTGRVMVEYTYDAWGNFTEYYPVTIPSYSYH